MLVANAFLIHSYDIRVQIAEILDNEDTSVYKAKAATARQQYAKQYIAETGRLTSDSQTAYALAICFNLLAEPSQLIWAGDRLAEIVRANEYCVVTMGATTIWERWDSMLPDGSINPGDMTSFNHYAYGAIAKFMVERVAGLKQLEPAWTRCRVDPCVGGGITAAKTSHLTPHGRVSVSWKVADEGEVQMNVFVPPFTEMEVVFGNGDSVVQVVGHGEWSFKRHL
ncbi:hypothetical protein J7337_006091 [Fusarium musae]|uniref:alpha-L-rhamnosidase n=1 Tax=Fusarium musae TaxID=1042133 RepID=A0A9P8DJY2_9HYPO|nr:hypothetical protein J7337_006091 [Fusarium musae]KAG9503248.1 hypothetical protein J7337_006091 [Fusarium musae]